MHALRTLEGCRISAKCEEKGIRSKSNVSARALTTFGLGGNVVTLIEPRSFEELQTLLEVLNEQASEYKILGAGSNVVFGDDGISEPLIRLGKYFTAFSLAPKGSLLDWARGRKDETSGITQGDKVSLHAFSAASLMSLSRETCQQGLSGLEFAAGIPASIGGAIAMNAGAHGHSLSEVVRQVLILTRNGELVLRSSEEMFFAYRHAKLGEGEIVIGAEFELVRGEVESIKRKRNTCLDYRKRTQPLTMPSAGSVFKNPSQEDWAKSKIPHDEILSAGAMLDRLGLKGLRRGGVAFSEIHANWLVRVEELGRTADALELIAAAKEKAASDFGIVLSPEIILWT